MRYNVHYHKDGVIYSMITANNHTAGVLLRKLKVEGITAMIGIIYDEIPEGIS